MPCKRAAWAMLIQKRHAVAPAFRTILPRSCLVDFARVRSGQEQARAEEQDVPQQGNGTFFSIFSKLGDPSEKDHPIHSFGGEPRPAREEHHSSRLGKQHLSKGMPQMLADCPVG